MTIKTNNKKNFEAAIKEYRAKGYNLITYTAKLAEMEKENKIIVISR